MYEINKIYMKIHEQERWVAVPGIEMVHKAASNFTFSPMLVLIKVRANKNLWMQTKMLIKGLEYVAHTYGSDELPGIASQK